MLTNPERDGDGDLDREGDDEDGVLMERGIGFESVESIGESDGESDDGRQKGSSSSVMNVRPIESAEINRPGDSGEVNNNLTRQ